MPIGLTAANTQSPMIMHMEYKVSLPDHDFVIAPKHKAIPSVYGGIVLQRDGLGDPTAVGFSGPTYIGVRSGKHSSSTALAHGRDFNRLLNLEEFRDLAYNNGFIKPVVIMSVDGGPDENPRYQKVFSNPFYIFI